MNNNAKPFIKWAGGKNQLLDQFNDYFPERLKNGEIKKYVEPFVGGGAVFFYLNSIYNFEKVVLNDINEEIVITYKVLQNNVYEIIQFLNEIQKSYLALDSLDKKSEFYYNERILYNSEKKSIDYTTYNNQWIEHAGRMIFLNKTCFNGLYRLNRKGEYNVPFGKHKSPTIFDEKNLIQVSKTLENVILISGDFENVSDHIDSQTFIYVDPPYRPLSATSSFNDYSKEPFNDESQVRLAKWIKNMNNKGAAFMLSNSDPKNVDEKDTFFDELYKEYNISRVYAGRAINSKGNSRGKISELLILNEIS